MTISDTYNLRNIGVNALRIADAIDALVIGQSYDTFGATSSTSAGFADVSGASASITTVSGHSLLLLGTISLSHSASGTTSALRFDVDGGGGATQHYWTARANDTGGDDANMTLFHFVAAPSVGAHTVKIQWLTASGTVHTAGGAFVALALRTS